MVAKAEIDHNAECISVSYYGQSGEIAQESSVGYFEFNNLDQDEGQIELAKWLAATSI